MKLILKKTAMPQRARESPNGCTLFHTELEQDWSQQNKLQIESFGQEAADTVLNHSQNERVIRAQPHK